MTTTKVFISYASEDKEFVEPLATALNQEFAIFYAPVSLTWGDSLRRVIGKHLVECDYGIVVMSPAFFSKDWPQDELDALQALEQENRKMILPIWKDLEFKDVRTKVPFLANRLALDSKLPHEAFIKAMRQVVFTRDQTLAFREPPSPKEKLLSSEAKAKARKRAQQMANSPEGVTLVNESTTEILRQLQEDVEGMSGTEIIKVHFERKRDGVEIHGPRRLKLQLPNSFVQGRHVGSHMLSASYFRSSDSYTDAFGDKLPHVSVQRFKFYPTFDEQDAVVWEYDSRKFFPKQVAELLLDYFITKVSEDVEKAQRCD